MNVKFENEDIIDACVVPGNEIEVEQHAEQHWEKEGSEELEQGTTARRPVSSLPQPKRGKGKDARPIWYLKPSRSLRACRASNKSGSQSLCPHLLPATHS